MARITIEIKVQPTQPQHKVLCIPHDARIIWYTQNDKLHFAYCIGGVCWTPRVKELKKFSTIYGTRAYKPLAEYMRGESVELLRVCL